MSDHGSRGWEATANGWRCTECRQEVVGPIDVAIDDAHVCTPPRPVPEEGQCGGRWNCVLPAGHNMGNADIPENHQCGCDGTCLGEYCPAYTPATVPAPHAEAEAAWEERIQADFANHPGSWRKDPDGWFREGWIAGFERGRGDRG